jgi:hypothetical protein
MGHTAPSLLFGMKVTAAELIGQTSFLQVTGFLVA